ncbi:TPA: glucosyltransferase domain-containing protein, partial [Citrobacter freundii]|nr:glucosyltransferase domain-containing protein [Citrobacter freundii]
MNRLNTSIMIASLFFMPFIISNISYFDDMGRIALGYYSWSVDGRPLSDLTFRLLSLGGDLTDLFPYTYLLSIVTLSIVIMLMTPKEYKLQGIIISSCSFISWNYIQNAAYRFDNITMALSLMFCVAAAYFNHNRKWMPILKTILLLCGLCTYQTSIGAYISLSLFLVANRVKNNKIISLVDFIDIILPIILSLLLYRFIIIDFFVSGDYAKSNGTISSSPENFFANLYNYFDFFLKTNLDFLLKFYYAIIIASTVSCFFIVNRKKEYINGFTSKILLILAPLIITLSVPSFMLFFNPMTWAVRAYISFGFSVACMLLLVYIAFDTYDLKSGKLFVTLFALVYIAYTFGAVSSFIGISNSLTKRYDKIGYSISQ